MKNDLLIKCVMCLIGVIVALGGFVFSDSLGQIRGSLQSHESILRTVQTTFAERGERIVSLESSVKAIGRDVDDIKSESSKRDEKLDKILDKLTKK